MMMKMMMVTIIGNNKNRWTQIRSKWKMMKMWKTKENFKNNNDDVEGLVTVIVSKKKISILNFEFGRLLIDCVLRVSILICCMNGQNVEFFFLEKKE